MSTGESASDHGEGIATISECYRRYFDELHALASFLLGDREVAEDIVHDIFTRICAADAGGGAGRVGRLTFQYLQAAVRNAARNYHRNSRTEARVLTEWSETKSAYQSTLLCSLRVERGRRAKAVLDRLEEELPSSQREIFRRVHREGLTYEEAAAALHTSVANVKKQVYRARCRLRELLAARGVKSLSDV